MKLQNLTLRSLMRSGGISWNNTKWGWGEVTDS